MIDELRTFEPFRFLDRGALATVARHANRLRLPEQRTVRRRGQRLARELFLVAGVVAVHGGTGVARVSAGSTEGRSLDVCAPDDAEISTVTAVEMIAVDLSSIRHLLDGGDEVSSPEVASVDDWMDALLQGPVLRWFPPTVWARLLRTGTLKRLSAGERIVARGSISDGVFVVAQGFVRFAGNHLSRGEFFAEESALMQCPADDDAVMETDGAVVCFARADIFELLAEYDAPRTDSPQRLDLDESESQAGETLLASLDPQAPVALRGGDPARRLVVAAKLMRRGITVV